MEKDKEKHMKALDALTEFLGSSEGQSAEEIKEELRSEGMNVNAALARLKKAQESMDLAARRSVLAVARKKRLELAEKGHEFVGKFKGWSKAKMLARIREMIDLDGSMFGVAYRELESMGDEEIESILEDMEMGRHMRDFEDGDNGESDKH